MDWVRGNLWGRSALPAGHKASEPTPGDGSSAGEASDRQWFSSWDALYSLDGATNTPPEDQVDRGLLQLIPEQMIRQYRLFPVKKEKRRLFVAMVDVLNVLVIDELRMRTGLEIEPVPVSEKEINCLIERNLRLQEVDRALNDYGEEPEEQEVVVNEPTLSEAPLIRLVNSLILKGIEEEASDIHIETFEEEIRLRYRVDGLLGEDIRLPKKMSQAIISRIKVMAGLDIAERRLPQDGRITLPLPERRLDLRVSTMDTIFGEKVVIRILDKESIKRYNLEKLGFSEYNLGRFTRFLQSSYGMVLVTGPTGSGKTTTLYTALRQINNLDKNLVTVEDPVEYTLDGVNQTQVNVRAGATFATYMRSVLRQDPDVIMVGEIRDRETAEMAVRAATTGHLVFSSMHTVDAPGSVTRLMDMGIEPFMVAAALLGVVTQRLVRRVCSHCREAYLPDQAEMAFAKLATPVELFKGRGCEECNFTGYHGRVAIQEVLSINPELKYLIVGRVAGDDLRKAALMGGMQSIKDDGIEKALRGITTISEIMRISFCADNSVAGEW
jgi:type IV pilus assembly protein PilB